MSIVLTLNMNTSLFPMTSVEIDWLVGVPLGEGGGGGLDSSEEKCITDGLAILKEVKKYNY